MNLIPVRNPLAYPVKDNIKGAVMTSDSNPKLQVTPTAIPEVLIIEPKVFGDNRGWFTESFNANDFANASGLNVQFVQDNTPSLGSGRCGECITNSNTPQANWYE